MSWGKSHNIEGRWKWSHPHTQLHQYSGVVGHIKQNCHLLTQECKFAPKPPLKMKSSLTTTYLRYYCGVVGQTCPNCLNYGHVYTYNIIKLVHKHEYVYIRYKHNFPKQYQESKENIQSIAYNLVDTQKLLLWNNLLIQCMRLVLHIGSLVTWLFFCVHFVSRVRCVWISFLIFI